MDAVGRGLVMLCKGPGSDALYVSSVVAVVDRCPGFSDELAWTIPESRRRLGEVGRCLASMESPGR